jgi:hypothetical protein
MERYGKMWRNMERYGKFYGPMVSAHFYGIVT